MSKSKNVFVLPKPSEIAWAAAPGYEISAAFEKVTPAWAKAVLAKQQKNRPLTPSRVALYTRQMAAGEWHPNNQGIGLGPNEELYDGQNRLSAVVASGVTVVMLVVRNVAPIARKTIDVGKVRSTADQVAMFGDLPYPRESSLWCKATSRLVYGNADVLSVADIETWGKANADHIAWAVGAFFSVPTGLRKALVTAPVMAAMIFARHRHPAEVDAFFAQVVSGANLDEGDPAFTLRNYLIGQPGGVAESGKRTVSLKSMRAVRYYVEKESILRLVEGEEGFRYFMSAHTSATLPPAPKPSGMRAEDIVLVDKIAQCASFPDIARVLAATRMTTEDVRQWLGAFRAQIPHMLTEHSSEGLGRVLAAFVVARRAK